MFLILSMCKACGLYCICYLLFNTTNYCHREARRGVLAAEGAYISFWKAVGQLLAEARSKFAFFTRTRL